MSETNWLVFVAQAQDGDREIRERVIEEVIRKTPKSKRRELFPPRFVPLKYSDESLRRHREMKNDGVMNWRRKKDILTEQNRVLRDEYERLYGKEWTENGSIEDLKFAIHLRSIEGLHWRHAGGVPPEPTKEDQS